ncbi:MAG TPA: RIP metalloprotease RseP [Nitrospiria bacterium]|nr:RIP metalloprotease RseP [Nitrospiria bacterium]
MEAVIHFLYNLFYFLIVLSVLIFFHELGHFLAARRLGVKVLKFSLGFGPRLIGRTVGETEYLISALPLGGYVKLFGEEPDKEEEGGKAEAPHTPEDRARSFAHQPVWKRIMIVAAGPVFNMLLAYLIFSGSLSIGVPMYVPDFDSLMPVIETVVEKSPAEAAGFKQGDRIVSINERKISTWAQMTEMIYGSAGKPLSIVVERDHQKLTLTVTPAEKTIETEEGKKTVGQIGIGKSPHGAQIEAANPLEAFVKGFQATWQWTYLTVEGLVRLVQGKLSMDNIGGPILIGQMSGQAASQGIGGLLFLIAILSITLGVMNILPIPVLDGGHLLFFVIEAVLGRPLSIRKREIAQQIGLAMLLLLMALAFYNDIIRLFVKPG